MKLDIGGGFNRLVCLRDVENPDGWTVVDKFQLGQPNTLHADAWSIPLDDHSVDDIFSSHLLEHMPFSKVVPTLQEWHRILKPDGRLRLYIPDLAYCVRTWLEAPEDHPEKWGWFIKIIFGGQEYEGDAHLTGFTPTRITHCLTEAGFAVTPDEISETWCAIHNQAEIRIELKKPI